MTLLYMGCRRDTQQESVDGTKYLIVAQAVFSFLVISSNLGLAFVEYLPRCFCSVLPCTMVMSLSLATFNFTFLAIVEHAQATRKLQLRYNIAVLIIVAVSVLSTALLSPIIYSSVVGLPIIRYRVPARPAACQNTITTMTRDVTMIESFLRIRVAVASYLVFYLVLQFVIPHVIIINRFILVGLTDSSGRCGPSAIAIQPTLPARTALERYVNIASLASVIVLAYFLSRPQDNEETTLAVLNVVFHNFSDFSNTALLLCCFSMLVLYLTKNCKDLCRCCIDDNVCLAETTAIEMNDKVNLTIV